jgi:hypothetical protein
MNYLKKLAPHLLAFVGFIVLSLVYFYPVLQGKQITQSDIVQYTGMAKEQNDFRAETGEEPFWTNSAFGGMPTYQLGAKYPHNYVKSLDSVLRFLPRPADYLFLYFLGFYILLTVLKIDPLKAFFGALAFGFSTYLIIILGVGHNAKAHAIAYMPMVIAGVLLVFQKRFIVGGLLTMIAAALEIQANHFQMTYYLLLLLLIMTAYYSYQFIKAKDFKNLGISFGVFAIAGIFALGSNATNLMATMEYTEFSTRGKNELTIGLEGEKLETKSGMSYEYITEYSYGIAESLNLIAPRLFGGASNEKLDKNSNLYDFFLSVGAPEHEALDYANSSRVYWGDQTSVAAPAYIGAIVFFLFVLGMFTEKRKLKYVFLIGAIASLLLSWGKNFPIMTDFFIDYFPLYNKFRAVSSIQVILELCIPVLAILGLHSFFKLDKDEQWKALWKSTAVGLGVLALIFVSKGMFNFSTASDAYFRDAYGEIGQPFIDALKEDRRAMFTSDLLRSMGLISAVFIIFWMYTKDKMSQTITIVLVGSLMVLDLVVIDKNYVNEDSFVNARQVIEPFQPSPADLKILQDSDPNFRVFEPSQGMASGRTSYFHKAIGGYSAVKPQRIQQLYDYQIANNNMQVLNMLNVKYVIQTTEEGEPIPLQNPGANGNAWFVENVKFVNSADAEMKALEDLNTLQTAVINSSEFNTMFTEKSTKQFVKDSLATIKLTTYEPNYLKYTSTNSNVGLAVFSEVYYKNGWIATIDGKEVPIFRTNFVLRGIEIPAGKHDIEFRFEPVVVQRGGTISLISSIGMLILLLGGIYWSRRSEATSKN